MGYFLFLSDFVEIVHIELPDKGGELFVFEILGKDLVFKAFFVFDDKGVALVGPLDDVGVDWILQNPISLDDEVRYFRFFLGLLGLLGQFLL